MKKIFLILCLVLIIPLNVSAASISSSLPDQEIYNKEHNAAVYEYSTPEDVQFKVGTIKTPSEELYNLLPETIDDNKGVHFIKIAAYSKTTGEEIIFETPRYMKMRISDPVGGGPIKGSLGYEQRVYVLNDGRFKELVVDENNSYTNEVKFFSNTITGTFAVVYSTSRTKGNLYFDNVKTDEGYVLNRMKAENLSTTEQKLYLGIYDVNNRLVDVMSYNTEDIALESEIQLPKYDNGFYIKGFMWDSGMKYYHPGKCKFLNSVVKEIRKGEYAEIVIDTENKNLSGIEYIYPERTAEKDSFPTETEFYNVYNKAVKADENVIYAKQNGYYMIHVIDENSVESFEWIYIDFIDIPKLELNAVYSEGSAEISVDITSKNLNANIGKIVWRDKSTFSDVTASLYNIGEAARDYIAITDNIITDNKFTVTESGEYVVYAVDEWGNVGEAVIRIEL